MATRPQRLNPDGKHLRTGACGKAFSILPADGLFLSLGLAVCLSAASLATVFAQTNASTTNATSSTPSPVANVNAAAVRSCPEAPTIMAQTVAYLSSGISTNRLSSETLRSPTVQRLRSEFSPLRSQGKLDDLGAVSEAAVRATTTAINSGVRASSVSGPVGAKVLAVYKKPGEIVHRGERIALILYNNRELPIESTVDGVMQEINITKGGVLGNRPRSSVQNGEQISVQIALISPLLLP